MAQFWSNTVCAPCWILLHQHFFSFLSLPVDCDDDDDFLLWWYYFLCESIQDQNEICFVSLFYFWFLSLVVVKCRLGLKTNAETIIDQRINWQHILVIIDCYATMDELSCFYHNLQTKQLIKRLIDNYFHGPSMYSFESTELYRITWEIHFSKYRFPAESTHWINSCSSPLWPHGCARNARCSLWAQPQQTGFRMTSYTTPKYYEIYNMHLTKFKAIDALHDVFNITVIRCILTEIGL